MPLARSTTRIADIVRSLQNSTTPAAKLAIWQLSSPSKNLEKLRTYMAPGYPCRPCNFPANPTLADWRKALIHDPAFCSSVVPNVTTGEEESDNRGPRLYFAHEEDWRIRHYTLGRCVLDHQGWFIDGQCYETIEACAVELKKFPGLIFEAVRESMGGSVTVFLTDSWPVDYSGCENSHDAFQAHADTVRDCIRGADNTAQSMAEDEREYHERQKREAEAEAEAEDTLDTPLVAQLVDALRYLLEQTVEMDLHYGIELSEGEIEAREQALAAITNATKHQ